MLQNHLAVIQAAHDAAQPSGGYDQITVILTAMAVILAALGVMFAFASIVLGLLAFIGYNDVRRMMREQNEKLMQDFFGKYPTPQQLRDELFNKATAGPSAQSPMPQIPQHEVELPQEGSAETFGRPYPGS
jgi:hypothetical protein